MRSIRTYSRRGDRSGCNSVRTVAAGGYSAEPEGLGSDPNGAIYVANTYGFNILKFVPPASRPVMKIKDPGFRPSDVAIDSTANVRVAFAAMKLAGRAEARFP